MKKKSSLTKIILNRRARHDYDLGDSLIVGLELTGAEVKALRMGHGHLRGAYVTVKDNELWLINATITGTNAVRLVDQDQTRTRKLLAKRKEIDDLITAKQQGLTIVPLELITKGRFIKLKIAAGRGKKLYDKRADLKKHEQERAAQAATKFDR
ncbi:MAG TPA: SsrA-binding protein SmpB [Candidatus Saccharimonadales bacterium]|nr:SsrA-binding protein SmpB [Candidatus Saccharimonadales bacterium]